MIQTFEHYVLQSTDILKSFLKIIFIQKITCLYAFLGIFIRIERCYAAVSRSEGFARKPLFLTHIKKDMIWHEQLYSVRYEYPGSRYPLRYDIVHLLLQLHHIQCHSGAYDISDIFVKHT